MTGSRPKNEKQQEIRGRIKKKKNTHTQTALVTRPRSCQNPHRESSYVGVVVNTRMIPAPTSLTIIYHSNPWSGRQCVQAYVCACGLASLAFCCTTVCMVSSVCTYVHTYMCMRVWAGTNVPADCSCRFPSVQVYTQPEVQTETPTHTQSVCVCVLLMCLLHFIVSQFAIQGHDCDSLLQLLCENFPCVNWDCDETRQATSYLFCRYMISNYTYWLSVSTLPAIRIVASEMATCYDIDCNWASIMLLLLSRLTPDEVKNEMNVIEAIYIDNYLWFWWVSIPPSLIHSKIFLLHFTYNILHQLYVWGEHPIKRQFSKAKSN